MYAGKTSQGYDLLSGIKLSDLPCVASSAQPDRIISRVQSIIEQQPQVPEDLGLIEASTRASGRGDRNATELLVFGDLEELAKSPAGPEVGGSHR